MHKLPTALFALRLGVFSVMFMWTLDKFLNPDHTAAVFSKFYGFDTLSQNMSYGAGAIQMLIIIGFLLGIKKKWTYGLVFAMHGFSTVSTATKLLDPWSSPNLLFYAAIPMLMACYALYIMRDEDTLYTWKK